MKPRYPVCILATACVPWNKDHTFAADIFRRQVRHLIGGLTRHIYIFGTAGEGYAVTDRQFDEICRVFREETRAPRVHGMVGVMSLSLPVMIERIERARAMGFREFQISLPSWGALNDRELFVFFREVCGRFPDCRFLHYNLLRTKRLVTPAEYARLAQEHPNLVATKNSTDSIDRLNGLQQDAPQLTHFFTETGYAYARPKGPCGLLISVASTNFCTARQFFTARPRQLADELRRMTADLLTLGAPEAHMDGAYDKLFAKLHDPAFPLRLLPPYDAISDDTFRRYRNVLKRRYPRWS